MQMSMIIVGDGRRSMRETGAHDMTRFRWTAAAIALAVTVAACGGDDDAGSIFDAIQDAQDDTPDQQVETPPVPSFDDSGDSGDSDSSDEAGLGVDSTSEVPIVRFAAHGPQADNTIGPGCADGIDARGGDLYRFTPPVGWEWRGTSGGTGYDEVQVRDGDVSLFVTESAYDFDTAALREWEVIGPADADVEIDGISLPIMEVSLEGNTGYALVDFDYMSPIPGLFNGAATGTVALTSAEPGRPTLDDARQLLGSVRIERCAAVSEAMIWGPAGGVHLVPRFEPDPLGKPYPDQPQPSYEPTVFALDAYSLEQIAYLMPVEPGIAMCAADKAMAFGAGNPIAYLFMFAPSGNNRTDLEAIIAEC
jgi:hypothetical protein